MQYLLIFSEFAEESFVVVVKVGDMFSPFACVFCSCIALIAFGHCECSSCILALTHADISLYITLQEDVVLSFTLNKICSFKTNLGPLESYDPVWENHLIKNLEIPSILFSSFYVIDKCRILCLTSDHLKCFQPLMGTTFLCCTHCLLKILLWNICIECYSMPQSRGQCCSAIRGIGSLLIGQMPLSRADGCPCGCSQLWTHSQS